MNKHINSTLTAAIAAVSVCLVASCGNKTSNEATDNDSTAIDTEIAMEEPEVEQPYNDLATWELQGNVKTCEWKYQYATNTYTFDEKGMLTNVSGIDFTSINRDDNGRIVRTEAGEFDMGYAEEWAFNGHQLASYKFVDGFSELTTTYTYGDDGFVASTHTTGSAAEDFDCEPEEVNRTNTYTYSESDSNGNWTKRNVKSTDGATWTETRKITYY